MKLFGRRRKSGLIALFRLFFDPRSGRTFHAHQVWPVRFVNNVPTCEAIKKQNKKMCMNRLCDYFHKHKVRSGKVRLGSDQKKKKCLGRDWRIKSIDKLRLHHTRTYVFYLFIILNS